MNYSSIRTMDISNGDGIRVSLFVSGCRFNCEGCFNQEVQNYNHGKPYTPIIQQTIVNHLQKPHIAGLSLLGGDPLWQDSDGLSQLITICQETHKLGKTVWLWSGFTWEEIFPEAITDSFDVRRVLQQTLILSCDIWVDGLFEEAKKDSTLKWRGSSNQRVIDIGKSISRNKPVLYEEEIN